MSMRLMKTFACFILCFFIAVSAACAETVSDTETPAIEEDFWLSENFTLCVLDNGSGERREALSGQARRPVPHSNSNGSGERRVEIYLEDHQTGNQVLWVFFALDEGQEWWLEDTPFESWDLFRPVWVEGRSWFWIYKMPGDVYALYESYQDQGVISYLIPGEKSALLWDTGMGIVNIREYVEQLTDLPVTVLNSHDHFDHTGGNYLFENVMCYNLPSAIKTLTEGKTHAELLEYVDPKLIVNAPADFDKEHFYRIGKTPTATVEDGQVIDLGGRKLEVLYTPGHSSSSIMLVDEANGLLFTGDTWYPGPLYAYFEDSSLPDYVESMRRAGQVIRERNIRWIYPSHNEVPVGTDLFFETTDFLQDVLDGKIDYQMDEGMRCYTMNSTVSLYMKPEETGEENR